MTSHPVTPLIVLLPQNPVDSAQPNRPVNANALQAERIGPPEGPLERLVFEHLKRRFRDGRSETAGNADALAAQTRLHLLKLPAKAADDPAVAGREQGLAEKRNRTHRIAVLNRRQQRARTSVPHPAVRLKRPGRNTPTVTTHAHTQHNIHINFLRLQLHQLHHLLGIPNTHHRLLTRNQLLPIRTQI